MQRLCTSGPAAGARLLVARASPACRDARARLALLPAGVQGPARRSRAWGWAASGLRGSGALAGRPALAPARVGLTPTPTSRASAPSGAAAISRSTYPSPARAQRGGAGCISGAGRGGGDDARSTGVVAMQRVMRGAPKWNGSAGTLVRSSNRSYNTSAGSAGGGSAGNRHGDDDEPLADPDAGMRRTNRGDHRAVDDDGHDDTVLVGVTPESLPRRLSSTVIVKGIGSTLLENDIRRLVPLKKHLPEFRDHFDIIRVHPDRDPNTLDRRPLYHLRFESPRAAAHFFTAQQREHHAAWTWTPASPFPPGSQPSFSMPEPRAEVVVQQSELRRPASGLLAGPAGTCVLLTVAAVAGGSKSTGRLPQTREVRAALEAHGIGLRDEVGSVVAVQRLLAPPGEAAARAHKWWELRGGEGRWIVRCTEPAEARRIVRDFHRVELWPGSGRFRAEVLL